MFCRPKLHKFPTCSKCGKCEEREEGRAERRRLRGEGGVLTFGSEDTCRKLFFYFEETSKMHVGRKCLAWGLEMVQTLGALAEHKENPEPT